MFITKNRIVKTVFFKKPSESIVLEGVFSKKKKNWLLLELLSLPAGKF